jgi:periplasmic protein TonB
MEPAPTSDADYKAAHLNNPRPPYPQIAVRQGAEGRVLLLAEVLPDGRAGSVRVEQSSGHAVLDAAAMNTVRLWRFTPARKNGVFSTQTVRIPIDFNLNEGR